MPTATPTPEPVVIDVETLASVLEDILPPSAVRIHIDQSWVRYGIAPPDQMITVDVSELNDTERLTLAWLVKSPMPTIVEEIMIFSAEVCREPALIEADRIMDGAWVRMECEIDGAPYYIMDFAVLVIRNYRIGIMSWTHKGDEPTISVAELAIAVRSEFTK